MTQQKTAILYRMVMDDHICPFGLKAKSLLKRRGYTVEDHHITSREEQDAVKARYDVKTTPQIFIDDVRIGGYADLRVHFGIDNPNDDSKTYTPIIAIFATCALMAGAVSTYRADPTLLGWLINFVALSMCVLAIQKLRDLEGFTTGFLNYDLLAQRWVPYAYIYPFAEAVAGILMIGYGYGMYGAPVALFIGTIGAISVIKAVYIDKRDLKCACVGGGSNVPLGAISLTENFMMIGMGIYMLSQLLG
jgi:glutaredoxin